MDAPSMIERSPRGWPRLSALAMYVLPWIAMGWLATSQSILFYPPSKEPLPFGKVFLWQGPAWLVWAAYTPLIVYLTRRLGLGAPGRRARVLLLHFALGLSISVQYTAAVMAVQRALSINASWRRPFFSELWQMVGRMLDSHLFIYAVIVALVYSSALQRKSREHALRAAQLSRQLAQAQLASLKRQLQPHFLFNTLHTIGLLVRKQDRDGAVGVLSDLADLLRAVLDQDGRQLVPLREELGLLDRYLAIERVRFQDRLRVELLVEPEALPVLVPNLLLQPLVENALRHGLAVRDAPGWVCVRARCVGARLLLEVEDDGVGLPPESLRREGTGLRNTRERLRHLYPGEHRFALLALLGGTRVELELPRRGPSAALSPREPADEGAAEEVAHD